MKQSVGNRNDLSTDFCIQTKYLAEKLHYSENNL